MVGLTGVGGGRWVDGCKTDKKTLLSVMEMEIER